MASGSISIRKFIRWLPDEASEPTSTLVLSSPQRRFVDLRILVPVGAEGAGDVGRVFGTLPLERLDWAIAGRSSSSARDDGCGGQISHSVFYHWIDSRTDKPEDATDAGDMYPQPDGTTLEKGAMENPDTGLETQYEELWLDVDPGSVARPAGMRCAVLELDDGHGGRGRTIRLGPYCQAFRKSGNEQSLDRWVWSEGTGWEQTVNIGSLSLPSAEVTRDGASFMQGDIVNTGDGIWKVIEVTES